MAREGLISEFRRPVDLLSDIDHLAPQAVISFQHIGHFLAAVHHRGMVTPAQGIADLRQRDVGFFAQQVHGNLARQGRSLGSDRGPACCSTVMPNASATSWTTSVRLDIAASGQQIRQGSFHELR